MAGLLKSAFHLSHTAQCLSGLKKVNAMQVRFLNLLEYQSKVLMENHGVNIQKFKMVRNADDAKTLSKDLAVDEYVVKAQILAGGRGKGHFSNGFKGGVHITKDANQIWPLAEKMVGHKLITKQTPPSGIMVNSVMVAESIVIKRETYFCILMDRAHNGPVLIASPAGGMDIEEVAVSSPHLVKTIPIDIIEGVTDDMALTVAEFLEFHGTSRQKCAEQVKALWSLFTGVDAVQLEINPLAETDTGDVVSVDAKIQFDDNAQFRQKDVFAMDDTTESDPREVEAAKYNLNYIGMSGDIGCLVNGAGLAMATMDLIHLHGGQPANFLDVGGSVNETQVKQAFDIISSDPNVKAILVNVFGGIVNCATIATGVVNATRASGLKLPLVVRLEGTNVDAAKKILQDSGLPIIQAKDLDHAAMTAVDQASLKTKAQAC